MKFTQMPYERVDFDKVKAEFAELEAGSTRRRPDRSRWRFTAGTIS